MAKKKKELEVEVKDKRREASIKDALKSKDFYDPKPVLDKKPDIICVWGQRSCGKTYGYLKHALENWKATGRTFVYVRRWAEDIVVKNMDKLMSPLPVKEIFGDTKYIQFFRGAFWLKDEEDKDYEECLGWAVALNQVAHVKSQTFLKAQIVILDEFLQLKSERVLRDEYDAWEQTLSTILRTTQDALIVIIGNSISKYSPYFSPLGIDPNSMKQGEIREIILENDVGEPTKVIAQWVEYNEKVGTRTGKYVRGSKMARTGEWEIEDCANIPHTDNEVAHERLLCSMFDNVMNINLGMFIREAQWTTIETVNGIMVSEPHYRQFIVIRQTNKQSTYWHLTTVKDLKYSTWADLNLMWRDIFDTTDIDIPRELRMGRVYAEDSFVKDYFYHTYANYLKLNTRDLL